MGLILWGGKERQLPLNGLERGVIRSEGLLPFWDGWQVGDATPSEGKSLCQVEDAVDEKSLCQVEDAVDRRKELVAGRVKMPPQQKGRSRGGVAFSAQSGVIP